MNDYTIATIELKDGQDGYDVVGEYIQRYWQHNAYDTVLVCISVSYDGRDYSLYNEVAYPDNNCDTIVFLNDWWEGEKFIKILGIEAVSDLRIHGGIYEE